MFVMMIIRDMLMTMVVITRLAAVVGFPPAVAAVSDHFVEHTGTSCISCTFLAFWGVYSQTILIFTGLQFLRLQGVSI